MTASVFSNKIKGSLWLAPMAGTTDLAYRRLCKAYQCDVTVSEMISSKALYFNDKKSQRMLKTSTEPGDKGVQIFGSDPAIFKAVTRKYLNALDISFIDINMGCPAPKIVRNGDGAALMKNIALAQALVDAVKSHTDKAVGVKFRLGWDKQSLNAKRFALAMQRAGADFVCLHARTREQMYSGTADWQMIAQLQAALDIPLIGNGDISSAQQAKQYLEQGLCDALMIGRAAQGRPWIFRQIKQYICAEEIEEAPDYWARLAIIKRHIELMRQDKADAVIVLQMRKHIGWYLKGLPGSAALKDAVNRSETIDQIYDVLHAYHA